MESIPNKTAKNIILTLEETRTVNCKQLDSCDIPNKCFV